MTGEFDWLQALIDANDQPVFAFDTDLRYTAFNSAHADVMRSLYGVEIALGGRLADYQTVKADRESAQAHLERALAGERVVASAVSGEPGRERYFDIAHDPLTDAAGTVVGVIVRAYDVSETKAAEEEVSTILRTTIDGYYLVDRDGRFLDTNDSYCQMIGHSREELLQMSVSDIEAIDTAEEIVTRIQRIMETGHDRFESKHRRKDGRVIDIEASVSLLRGDQEKLVVFMRDITERKRADEALAEKTRLAQIFMDALPCVALLLDRSRTVILPNKAAVEAGALPGTQCFSTWGQRADSCPWCLAPAALESGEAWHVVVEALGIVWDAHWIPVGPDLYLHYAFDVTERRRSEDALRESEGFLRGLFDNMPSGAAIYEVRGDGSRGSDYIIKDFNAASLRIEGKTEKEVVGKSLFDLRPAIDEYGLIPVLQGVWQTGKPALFPTTLYSDEHYTNWYENHVFRLLSGEVVAIYDDVTERKRSEDALRESEARLSDLIFSMADWMWEVDANGVFTHSSQKSFDFFGPTRGDVIGKTPFDLMPADEAERVAALFAEIAANKAPIVDLENWNINSDGERFCLLTNGVPLLDEAGDLKGYRGVDKDITERKQAQEDLRESEERLRFLIDQTPTVNWTLDRDLRFTLARGAGLEALGLGPDQVLGMYFGDYLGGSGPQVDLGLAMQRRALAGESFSYEQPIGNLVFDIIVGPLRDADGAVVGAVGVAYDASARKQAEEELLRHAEQLRRTVEGAVLAMSHMVESRDPYTAGHERRVSELAAAIGGDMGMAGADLEAMRLAGTIHDIGKVAVPAEILSKPGRLSALEFELIKQHSQVGFDILADVDFGRPVAEMVLQHHERLDGSGYPRALKGADILPEARILAVADVVEAMSSHRPYRAALGMEAALAEVSEHAGAKYDAEVVASCVKLVEEQGFQFTP